MANTPFTFPPPPPPPPKVQSSGPATQSFRGRGNYPQSRGRPEYNNRGAPHHNRSRGNGRGRGTFRGRGSYSNGVLSLDRHQAPTLSTSSTPLSNRAQPSAFSPESTLKRDHTTAFAPVTQKVQGIKAPPAVPSFNSFLDNLHPVVVPHAAKAQIVQKHPQKQNVLGLTPTGAHESESEGEDDERQFAGASDGQSLQIEYRGQVSSLKTAAEIAAWIAERRRRFPTQAKADAAKKEAEERKRKYDAERKARRDEEIKKREDTKSLNNSSAQAPKFSEQEQKGGDSGDLHAELLRARLNLETAEDRLRKLLEEQTQLSSLPIPAESKSSLTRAKAKEIKIYKKTVVPQLKETLQKLEQRSGHSQTQSIASTNKHFDAGASSRANVSDSEWTSSAGSGVSNPESDSDSDSAPQELASKSKTEVAVSPVQAPSNRQSRPRIVCRYMAQKGSCKQGRSCKFSHDIPNRDSTIAPLKKNNKITDNHVATRRKRLFQVMIEKEEEEDQKKVVQAIIALGEQGLLETASA